MKGVLKGSVTAMVAATMGAAALPAAAAESLEAAITGGKAGLDLRYRLESVDQDGIAKKATASTLRTRLNYATGSYMDASAFIEFDDVMAFGDGNYNDATGLPSAKTTYPIVADPEGTEVNQAFLSYKGLAGTTIKYGRQRVIFDNSRFIGNVGWRQNEQTYDGLTVANSSLKDTAIVYGYVNNVNTIFGEASAKGNIDTRSHLLNVSYSGLAAGKITGYGYFLDLTNAPAASNSTLGIRFAGGTKMSDAVKALYTLEYAKQGDYKDGASTIDASYNLIELGAEFSGITAMVGYEVLGADTSAFSTPLATLHVFNGWADKFLTTPANGLVDTYLSVEGKLADVKLQAVYHDFSADKGSASYGSEIDLMAMKKFGKSYTLLAKYASYNADTFATDTKKMWLMGQAQF